MAPIEVSELYTAPEIPTLMPTDRLVLLDLDGTLALNKGVRWVFRKGIEALPQMQRDGLKIGLFTNKSRANIPLAEIATATGVPDFKFDVILAGEQCYPPTKAYRRANPGLMKFDKLKSLEHYFPEHENVWIIEDTPEKVPRAERARVVPIATWKGGADDGALVTALARSLTKSPLDLLPFGTAPNVTTYSEEEMVEYAPGKRCVHPIAFANHVRCVVIRAGMGNGKSHAVEDYI